MNSTWDDASDPLAALRAGDPAPFERFVRQETPTFAGFFVRMGADRSEAEDLVQELFLKLYRHAETYRPQERFPAFAFRVARNAWIDRQRRRGARPGVVSIDAENGEDGDTRAGELESRERPVDAALERGEQAGHLRAALAQLPDHHRAVFELGVVQELSYAEIGAILDVPVGTVKSRMFHAVRKLRAALGEELAESTGGTPGTGGESR